MSIRLPLTTVISSDNSGEVGAGSVGGGVPIPFVLPQDTDNIVVKLTASTVGGGVSAVFQTTDDGGTTYYDVARTSIVSNANNTTAQWLSIPVISDGRRTTVIAPSVVATGSVVTFGSVMTTIGSAASSTIAQGGATGMPVLSQQARVLLIITGDLTASTVLTTKVMVNSQSATA